MKSVLKFGVGAVCLTTMASATLVVMAYRGLRRMDAGDVVFCSSFAIGFVLSYGLVTAILG